MNARKWALAISALTAAVAVGVPPAMAQAESRHIGDLCTSNDYTTCAGSASFIKAGDHMLIWDNKADHHSVVVTGQRSDGRPLELWNHSGSDGDGKVDHNLNLPENGWIRYKVCLGEYGTKDVLENTCSVSKLENAT
ncbi:hypothetical protein [Streptomyces albireticuli]|uniref:Secreted protein n=1 Tax=Streptomyces albireticuli TaxID=1940 RepID=A0A2A2CY70_9ACTN|nr:hypothetical protein [Streptomyces albireticuli]MCD9145708.1 hypothetical protein [Streptomyces albireticuli]MCD9165560.1 hypothetical protein [Streptomyces albireticuli]MCD9195917.1 hypothetical protein [Streptomyces albireticuli]PAU45158.1 hypothetical protein CK936_30830 [Streptomyces albireticuli]